MSSTLLSSIQDKRNQQSLSHGRVFPERSICATYLGLFELDSFGDDKDFVFDFLLGGSDAPERGAGVVETVAVLRVPAWCFGDEEDLGEDENRDEDLENDYNFPVPFPEGLAVEAGCVVDPVMRLVWRIQEGGGRIEQTSKQ